MRLTSLRGAVKRAGERVGVDVRQHRSVHRRRQHLMGERSIGLVIDVGAHRGDYVRALRGAGYRGRVLSFEPGSAQFAALSQAAAGDPLWSVRRLALSDAAGEAELAVADVFSSLLTATDRLTDAFPNSRAARTETVTTARLDDLEDVGGELGAGTLLKLDVQGNELRVLHGAERTLPRLTMLEVELSVTPLYAGQPLIAELLGFLAERGFRLVDLEPIGRDNRTGHHPQFDGIFVRD